MALALAGPNPTGLASADVIWQEISTPARYIAAYQSRLVSAAGPVTSTQPTDWQVLSVLHPLFGYNGAPAPFFLTELSKSKLSDEGYASHASLYTSGPQGLAASVETISAAARRATAPPAIFRYRGASSGATTLAAAGQSRPTSVQVIIPGYGTESWIFDMHADRWKLASGGPTIEVANLVVQIVPYKEIGINLRYGIGVLSAKAVGNGSTQVFSGSSGGNGGTAAAGTWSKPHIGEVTNYFDSSGSPMAFQPGPTWIILAPQGTQISTRPGN